MESIDAFLDLMNCKIRFKARVAEYEGVIREVIPATGHVIIDKAILLPYNAKVGKLVFRSFDIVNLRVLKRPDHWKEKDILPVSSDIDDCVSHSNYEMKLVWHLSKFVPRDFEIIDSFNKDFNLAIKHIKKQDAIGVSLEGINICRSGNLTWICISTPVCIFLIDILALGTKAFEKGLKSIFESPRIQKIFHDCRLASDCLYHKYGVRLVNLFDTQAADFLVMMQMVKNKKIDYRVNTLDACLNFYLEVPEDYLYGPANLSNDEGSSNYHALRPLKHEIQDVLINNVMYLHLLQKEITNASATSLRRATDVYLNSVLKLDDKELLVMDHKPGEIPPDMHLEGMQIFHYMDFEHLCTYRPAYQEVPNPKYLNHCAAYKDGLRKDSQSILNKNSKRPSPVPLEKKASGDLQKSSSNVSCSDNKPATSQIRKPGVNESIGDHQKSASNVSCSDNKPGTSQIGKPAVTESIGMCAALKRLLANAAQAENSANPKVTSSKSIGKDGVVKVNDVVAKTDVQINNSVMKKGVDVSDSQLKEKEARARERAAAVRYYNNISSACDSASTSDLSNRKAQDKLVKGTDAFKKNQRAASEEVTVSCSEILGKPSKLAVTVNQSKPLRLADLYKEAGDRSVWWTDEPSGNLTESSSSVSDEGAGSEDIWAKFREDMPCKPIDEKLRARLIPAGMRGY